MSVAYSIIPLLGVDSPEQVITVLEKYMVIRHDLDRYRTKDFPCDSIICVLFHMHVFFHTNASWFCSSPGTTDTQSISSTIPDHVSLQEVTLVTGVCYC